MGSCFRPTRPDPRHPGKRIRYRRYRIVWVDENGDRCSKMAYTDKQASEAMLAKIERDVERKKAGLPVVEETGRPWTQAVERYCGELVGRGSDAGGRHVYEVRRTLTKLAAACGWADLREARRDRISQYLADLAEAGKAPGTRRQVAVIVKGFFSYCVDMGWLAESPTAGLKLPKVGQAGRRRRRRAYTRAELARLLAAVPPARRTAYLIAALSGYRRKELRRIEKRDLTPTGDRPRWHVRAAVSKNGRCDVVPIVPDLLPVLVPLWSALPHDTSRLVAVPTSETLHRDLARAGIPLIDGHGRLMGEVLPIQKVKVLMRHKSIQLTADLYGELGIDDLGDDVWSLPPLGVVTQEPDPDNDNQSQPESEARSHRRTKAPKQRRTPDFESST